MKQDKFITVLVVLDDTSQNKLTKLQDDITKICGVGNETRDVPFHITLGSFDVKDKYKVIEKAKEVANTYKSFEVEYNKIGWFGNRVLFAEPIINERIMDLHSKFDNNFADGFEYHPHTTLFINEDIEEAKEITLNNFAPFKAKVVGIFVGEFFPTNKLFYQSFN